MHKRLKAKGILEDELAIRASLAKEFYLKKVGAKSMDVIQARQRMSMSTMDRMAARYQRNRTAAEIALAQAIEFPSDSTINSPSKN